jgi:ribosomal protein L11 methyltransferase
MAFGTGTHPTTQLCLELLDECLLKALPEGASTDIPSAGVTVNDGVIDAVIDIGCGSGILAVAALLLGAGHALAVDIDPEAVRASLANAALNGVADRLEIGQGSIGEILAGRFSVRRSPLVLANILAPILVRLLGDGLGDLLAPGGQLILSGILEDQVSEVLAAAEAQGLRLVERRQSGDWVALRVSP